MLVDIFPYYNLIVMTDGTIILWDSIASGIVHERLDCATVLELESYMAYGTRDRVNLFYFNE